MTLEGNLEAMELADGFAKLEAMQRALSFLEKRAIPSDS